MVRSELIREVAAKHPNLQMQEIQQIVDHIFVDFKDTLRRGERIEIRGFGSFSIKKRRPRQARNPRNEEPVFVPAKKAVKFKSGKLLRERLNGSG